RACLPGGAGGRGCPAALAAPAGAVPVAFALSAGTLPSGLALSSGGVLSGTPTAAGPASFTITATDAAGCTGVRAYSIDIFATPPVSSVAASTNGLAISSAHPCVSVPFDYARGESTPARGVTVSFQLDATKLALCSTPAASIHLGAWFTGFANTQLQVTDDGGGAYTVDASLVGAPCGITAGGTAFTGGLEAGGADRTGGVNVAPAQAHHRGDGARRQLAGAPARPAPRPQRHHRAPAPP